jgi:hypothetical protein
MHYPNNDLWTVRQVELLDGALEDMSGKSAVFWPDLEYKLIIPNVANYSFKGVLNFEVNDRTIIFEQGKEFGLTREDIISYLKKYSITFIEKAE